MVRHSILFGVQTYDASPHLTQLKCPANDVALMSEILEDEAFSGGRARNLALVDCTLSEAKMALADFLEDVGRDDVLIFYFAGHGMRDDRGVLHLCFRDTRDKNLALSGLSFPVLSDVFEEKYLRRVLVILDCCYSGAASVRSSVKEPLAEMERDMGDGKGFFVLSASGIAETAKEGETNGVFTHHFADGVRTGKADKNGTGEITVQDMALHLQKAVPLDAPGQNPLLTAHAQSGTFVVALNEKQRRARAALEQKTTRQSVFDAAEQRIKDAFHVGDADLALLSSVDGWIKANAEGALEDPAFLVLQDYGTKEIGLLRFSERWTQVLAEAEAEAQAAAKAEAEAQAAAKAEAEAQASAKAEAEAQAAAKAKTEAQAEERAKEEQAAKIAAQKKADEAKKAAKAKAAKAKAEAKRKAEQETQDSAAPKPFQVQSPPFDWTQDPLKNPLRPKEAAADAQPSHDDAPTPEDRPELSVSASLFYGALCGGISAAASVALLFVVVWLFDGDFISWLSLLAVLVGSVILFFVNGLAALLSPVLSKGAIRGHGALSGTCVAMGPGLFMFQWLYANPFFSFSSINALTVENANIVIILLSAVVTPIWFCAVFFMILSEERA